MIRLLCRGFLTLLPLLATLGCSEKPHDQDAWWVTMTLPRFQFIKVFSLPPHESLKLQILGSGQKRLGLVVKQVFELRDAAGSEGAKADVVLSQVGAETYIGTQYSASNVFDLSRGGAFEVKNRSTIPVDVAIYTDPNL